jgi:electron transfer flavoprotein beta subunit
MKILVCFKVVPDLDLLSGSGWEIDSHFRVETGFVKNILNPYDESALEMALKLADQAAAANQNLDLSALTIGDQRARLFLKTLQALNYNHTTRIECSEDLRFNPEMTATMISAYISNYGFPDLLIMGSQSGVGDNAKTPLLTAEILGWPCISQVLTLETAAGDRIRVASLSDDGIIKQTITPPCVLSVGNAPSANLRVPTLKAIKATADNPVEVISLTDLSTAGFTARTQQDCSLLGLKVIERKRSGTIIEGATAVDKAQALYDNYLKGWLARL